MRGGLCSRGQKTCVIDGKTTCIYNDEMCEGEEYAAVAPRIPAPRIPPPPRPEKPENLTVNMEDEDF